MRKKTHPGEILMKEVITPNNLTIEKAAELLGVTLSKLTDLVEGKISIDEELAQSIKQAFGGNEKTWINLQFAYDKSNTMKNKFIFIVGAVAAGKTTFMEKKLYNNNKKECNFFDHDQTKLMIQLYADDKSKITDINLGKALKNAINDSIENGKDFMMQIHFTNEQLSQINTYFHHYKNKFDFEAHYIAVNDLDILKDRANKRELLGGHSSEGKSIEKSFNQSFNNFIEYLPKLNKVTIWDNSKEFGFTDMEEQLIFEKSILVFENPNISDFAKKLLSKIKLSGNYK